MNDNVFLHYTKAEIERNFDQRGWIGNANAEAIIARCAAASRATRDRLAHRANLRYGPGADETLDVFTTERANAPVQIFVHGGAWKNFSKDDVCYVADAFVPAGVHVVILNFTNLPIARLPQMVAQVRDGIEWVYRNARSFGGDPARLYLAAHSSGAHLSAMALVTDWAARGLPADLIKGAALACGVYNLKPVMLSARSSYVQIDKAEEEALSPLRHVARIPCPVFVAYAEGDTDEFQRQSREFASALEPTGKLSGLLRVPGLNHFELMESISAPDQVLPRAILAHMNLHFQEA
jgi:arylformamidase